VKEFLKKIRLIDYLVIDLDITKNEFITKLKENVDEGSTGFMSDSFDMFSSSKNEYKGHVGFENFKIKRRKRLFDTTMNLAVASGTYRQKDNLLIINTEINGFSGMMIPLYIFILIFYSIFIVMFLFSDSIGGGGIVPALFFTAVHASLMLGLPYFMMRRSIKNMKRELDRDFYYLTRKR